MKFLPLSSLLNVVTFTLASWQQANPPPVDVFQYLRRVCHPGLTDHVLSVLHLHSSFFFWSFILFCCCCCSNFNVKCIFFVRGHNIYCLSYCSPSPCDSFSHSFFLFFLTFSLPRTRFEKHVPFLGYPPKTLLFLEPLFLSQNNSATFSGILSCISVRMCS